jgi:hypothetical protein
MAAAPKRGQDTALWSVTCLVTLPSSNLAGRCLTDVNQIVNSITVLPAQTQLFSSSPDSMSRDIVSSTDSHTPALRDPQTNFSAADPPVSKRKRMSFETSAALLGMN